MRFAHDLWKFCLIKKYVNIKEWKKTKQSLYQRIKTNKRAAILLNDVEEEKERKEKIVFSGNKLPDIFNYAFLQAKKKKIRWSSMKIMKP